MNRTKIFSKLTKFFYKSKINELPVPSFRASYSQHGEDLIVEHLMRLLNIENPFYIDVGAHHPHILSNTYLMYTNGGRGINIEPDPTLIKAFEQYRPEDITLQCGMRFDERTEADLFMMSAQVLNTFSEEEANHVARFGTYSIENKIKVKLLSLPEILDKYGANKEVDFISIDVEGVDFEVVKKNDIGGIRPKVLCIETVNYSEDNTSKKQKALIDHIIDMDYMVYADTWLNTIFVENNAWANR
jgi:FkbM family methyltransferase